MTKILGIIPARAGSKRLPGKNTKLFDGKPLITYSIASALNSTLITDIAVSSDSEEVLQIASNYQSVKAIKRPAELAGDLSPAIDYVKHAMEQYEKAFDYVVIIQASSPLTHSNDINQTIQLLLNHPEADSSVSVMHLDHAIHPVKLKTMKDNVLLPYWEEENGRMAAHELPELFVRNCAVYVSSKKSLESGKIIGDHCLGYLMPRERSVDINELIDFEFAELLYKKYFKVDS
jgi:CMP-N,N'-diacetyllegionaminic acid synthase